jgi:hypothetical protein
LQRFTGNGFEEQVIPLTSVITPAIIQVALEDPSSRQNSDGSFDFAHAGSGDAALLPRDKSDSATGGVRSGSRAGAIVAGVLVSVVGAATLAAVIVCAVKRRQIATQEWAHPLGKPLRISSSQNSANTPRFGPVVDSPRFTPKAGSPRSYSQGSGTASPRATYPGSPRFGGSGIGSCGSPRMNARLNAAGPLAEGVLAIPDDALEQAAIATKAAERWRSFGGTSSDGGASVASVDADTGICTEGISPSKPEPARCDPLKSARLHTECSDVDLPGPAAASGGAGSAAECGQAEPEISVEPDQAGGSLRPEHSSLGGALTEPYRHSLTSTEASDELPLPEVEPKAFMVSSNSLFEDEGVGLDEADQLPGWAPVRAPACHLLSLDEEDHMSDSSLDSK